MAGTATALSSTDALTSSHSATIWDLAVPLGPEVDTVSPTRMSNESSSLYNKPSYRHRTPNGNPRSRNSSQTGSRRGSNAHDTYGREIGPSNKDMGDAFSNGQHRKADHGGKMSIDSDGNPNEEDNWIHRDKLARIESEELQQAAMRIHRQVRAGSKSSSMRGLSYDSPSLNGAVTTSPEQTEPWPGYQTQELESPIPFEDSDGQEVQPERMNWDLRRPEEIAASSVEGTDEAYDASKFYKSPTLKKSSSRIPVLAPSPNQISSDPYEPSPEPNDSTTPPLSTSRPNSRGGILAPVPASPTKKTPVKGNPVVRKSSIPPNNRKPSGPVKPRATSGSSTNKDRPVTRSGENRPSTAVNRPEGDPPWLATMYKPDPRLPPDQQMLPTHAKKMQQEQWEKEGKTPSAYDRDFAPVAVRPDEPVQMPTTEKSHVSYDADNHATDASSPWPLQPPKSPEPARPGTSGTNYSTMPKLQTTPPVALPVTPRLQQSRPPSHQQEDQVEKGCGCCIVM